MKKKQVLLAVFAATMLTPTVAWAQYPQITGEAKENYTKMMTEERKRSDEAWAKALPIVQKEAKEGRPYIPWAGRPYDLPQADIPSFPGAEGGGMYSFGGRGGKVITVTNLNDRGPGSFREACETGGARIIVFNVAGIIRLESPIIVRAPYVTIAGQTAPGDGVCIAGESFWVDTHDVVVRHMRFRRGETKVWHRDDSFGGNPVGNIMIDHCSCTWGLDENISFYRHMYDPSEGQYESKDLKLPTVNVTIQNTISAKALDTYNHAFGSTLGGENCAFARNLWASNSGRNPSIGWNGIFNFVNNVVFNWVHRSSDGGDYEKYLNDCVSASNEIMTASGGYSLYQSGSQSYRNLFKSENAIDAEIILARDYNNDLSLVHKVQAFENSPTLGRPGLSKKLVNYYLMKNGNRFTDQPNYATMEFKDEIVNRDPRLAQTIRTSNINMNVTMTGYHLLKYANDNMSYTGDSSNDLPLFRLAEVYLNYAEAKAELGTLTQTDIDNTINKLRTRAGVTGKLNMNAANLSPDPYMCAPETGYVNVTGDNKGVILEIRRERAIELVMEGFRYYDLMRWKEGQCMAQSFKGFYLPATAINKAYDIDGDGTNDVCFYTTSSQPNVGSVTYVKLASDGSGTSLSEGNYGNLLCYSWIDRTWNENRDYLYPVPRQEITLSDGVVTQNPGWNE